MQLTSKGQVTVPKPFRDKFGLYEGVEIEFVEDNGVLKLLKATQKRGPLDKVYGVLKKNRSSDTLIEAMRGK